MYHHYFDVIEPLRPNKAHRSDIYDMFGQWGDFHGLGVCRREGKIIKSGRMHQIASDVCIGRDRLILSVIITRWLK